MTDTNQYAVFLFPQAMEALGEPIKDFMQQSDVGEHILCHEIDTGGALIEMLVSKKDEKGNLVKREIMLPVSMVRLIISTQNESGFGFSPRAKEAAGDLPSLSPIKKES